MKPLEVLDAEVMGIAIQQEIRRSEEARYDHRLHGVLLVSQGLDCCATAEYLGEHATTVQRWVRRFNESGFAGLYEIERPGRPSRLSQAQWAQVKEDLRRAPQAWGYGQNLWDGKLLSHHLERQYGVELGVRQCQRAFTRLDFRLRKPRPVIANADPEAQEAYKKTAPLGPRRKR